MESQACFWHSCRVTTIMHNSKHANIMLPSPLNPSEIQTQLTRLQFMLVLMVYAKSHFLQLHTQLSSGVRGLTFGLSLRSMHAVKALGRLRGCAGVSPRWYKSVKFNSEIVFLFSRIALKDIFATLKICI